MSMFITTISRLNKSGTINELDDQLSKAVQAVRLTGKVAKLTLEITIRPNDRDAETVLIEDSIKVKTASPPRKAAIFFTTEDGRLSRENPSQPDLPMKLQDDGTIEITNHTAKAATK